MPTCDAAVSAVCRMHYLLALWPSHAAAGRHAEGAALQSAVSAHCWHCKRQRQLQAGMLRQHLCSLQDVLIAVPGSLLSSVCGGGARRL